MSEGRCVSPEEEAINSSAVSSSTPGPSSVSSSEEVDVGTLTDDCLLPLPANLEDELAASQKEHQAYLGRYQFLEDKKKENFVEIPVLLLGDTSVSAPRAVETDYDASISSSESSDETSSDMPVLCTNAECSSSSFQRALNTEECHQLPNSSDDSLLFNSSCSTPVISSDLLVNSTETTQAAASNCTSQASRDSNDGLPVSTSVNSHSVFGSNEFSSGSCLNPTGSEQEALNSLHAGEESEQHENGEVTGACAAGNEERVERSVGANVRNIPWPQQGAFPSAEMATGGRHTSGAFNGTATDWERLGARPKQGQAQHSAIKQMPGEPFIPVTDGLAGDFLARNTQDKALHDSLYQSVDAKMHGDDCHFPVLCSVSRLADPTEARLGSTTSWPPLDHTGSAFLLPHEDVRNSALPEARAVPSCDPTRATGLDSTTTSWPLLVCHSSNTTTVGDDVLAQGSASGTSIPEPSCGNANNHRASVLNNRDFGTDSVESTDNSLVALDQRVAEACALVERVLREREEREQFGREIERKEQLIREQRARERREREEREIKEAERWPQQQEAITARTQWLCEHYQRHCRVRFPCCTQFFPCHRCHNISKACDNEEAKACHASHLKCSHCQHEQEIGEDSEKCRKCGGKMSAYFCSICKHFTSIDKNPYHCEKCGLCRIHKDKSFHCEVCNVCLDKRLQGNHKCRPDSGHDECCICLEIGEDSEKCRMCGSKLSVYFCFICQNVISADNNPYHCEKCGICRIHKDKSFHCEVCNVCLDKRLEGNHRCRPDSGHDECCFCLKDTFSGCQILPCSHKVHRECAIAMIQYGIRTCPTCHQPLRGT